MKQEKIRTETSLKRICFGLDLDVSASTAKLVGPEKFKRYEHALYIMGQFARLAYCDTGIIWKTMESALGMSSDVVDKVISAYDKRYESERFAGLRSQPCFIKSRGLLEHSICLPHESYALGEAPTTGSKYATYIATPDVLTCFVTTCGRAGNGRLLNNPNSIFEYNDVVVSFKGTSSNTELLHDLSSLISPSDFSLYMGRILGLELPKGKDTVVGSFMGPLTKAWKVIEKALIDHIPAQANSVRLFITGQSLGGAYCSLYGWMIAEAKVSPMCPAILRKIKTIHIVSFGAPTIMFANARNTFNRHLDSGLVTLDRIVSQAVAARSTGLHGSIAGIAIAGPLAAGQNMVPTLPYGFVHPGFRPLLSDIRPEANGRPYSLDWVRSFYGIPGSNRRRDKRTWPFPNESWDWDTRNNKNINNIVGKITGLTPLVDSDKPPLIYSDKKLAVPLVKGDDNEEEEPMKGGSAKSEYASATQNHIPNFLSVQGSPWAALSTAHGEYLGMFYFKTIRLKGMKNPVPDNSNLCAFFEIYPSGVKINYLNFYNLSLIYRNGTTKGGKKRKFRKTLKH